MRDPGNEVANLQTNCLPRRQIREIMNLSSRAKARATAWEKKHFRRLETIAIRTFVSTRLSIKTRTVVEKLASSRASGTKTQR